MAFKCSSGQLFFYDHCVNLPLFLFCRTDKSIQVQSITLDLIGLLYQTLDLIGPLYLNNRVRVPAFYPLPFLTLIIKAFL